MEQRERDESSSKLEEALRELTGAETTGKIEEYENEREGADVNSETACTDMRRAERMPAWRQEEDAIAASRRRECLRWQSEICRRALIRCIPI